MTERKYTAASIGPRIDGFLRQTLQSGGFKLKYEIQDSQSADGDFETPDVLVKFTGADVDLLLANRAEMLLALEHVTMEMLRMPSEDHSRISFDANDYRLRWPRGGPSLRRGSGTYGGAGRLGIPAG